jgi:tRNA-modifying protein YgfZ
MPDLTHVLLDDLTVLDLRGRDVVSFLQGQVTQDVTLLAASGSLLAGLANPQGRVLAVLRLLHVAPDHVLMVLPAEVADMVRQLLAKFVLRAKVQIADASTAWAVHGFIGPDAEAAASTRLCMPMDADGLRQLVVATRTEPLPEADPAGRSVWRLADIEAGMPEVLKATSGSFVAQMLNLDCIGAISLTKGCYTGQEVVARAHYRGQVKRRMQRFLTESGTYLEPGQRIQLSDGRSAQIVTVAPADGIGQQLLAVAPLSAQGIDEQSPQDALRLDCIPMPLPYSLP